MYSGPMCNFCEAAKRLFIRNNLEFKEIDISTKDGLMEEMIKKSNGKIFLPAFSHNPSSFYNTEMHQHKQH